jgi:hypothetical protein
MNADAPPKPGDDLTVSETLAPPTAANLPTVIPPPRKPSLWHRLRRLLSLLVLLLAIAGTGYWWWLRSRPLLPPGFA